MMQFTANTEQRLMLFANQLYELSSKRNLLMLDLQRVPVNPIAPALYPVPSFPLFTSDGVACYQKVLQTYYKENTENKFSVEFQKKVKKYYTDDNYEVLHSIRTDGEPNAYKIQKTYYNYIFSGYKVSYEELNKTKAQILQERGKFFKNKKKINELIEKHKKLRKIASAPSKQFIQVTLDKVFLSVFSYAKSDSHYYNDKRESAYTFRGYKKRNLFLSNSGWLCLPPYFFDETLYNLKSKDYKQRDVTYYLNFVPQASLALITKDLQAESGSSFFKEGVTEADVLKAVKQQAKREKELVKKLDIEYACNLLNEKLKTFVFDKKNPKNKLIVKFAYMGLDKLKEEELAQVASEIFSHYSSFGLYESYVKWFKNVAVPHYNERYKRYVEGVQAYNECIPNFNAKVASVLPAGQKDVPYLDCYLSALETGKYQTYFELCQYVAGIRRQDEIRNYVRQIASNQQKIQKQNQIIIANQNKLHEQNERHHTETMKACKDIITKLDEVESSLSSTEVIIYY